MGLVFKTFVDTTSVVMLMKPIRLLFFGPSEWPTLTKEPSPTQVALPSRKIKQTVCYAISKILSEILCLGQHCSFTKTLLYALDAIDRA